MLGEGRGAFAQGSTDPAFGRGSMRVCVVILGPDSVPDGGVAVASRAARECLAAIFCGGDVFGL